VADPALQVARQEKKIRNRAGMHARAAVKFVKLAEHYRSEIRVVKDGTAVNGKSIMGLLTLVAALGTPIVIEAEGVDAEAAVAALAALVEDGFGEGVVRFDGGGGGE
jgi:phosphocarrier protein